MNRRPAIIWAIGVLIVAVLCSVAPAQSVRISAKDILKGALEKPKDAPKEQEQAQEEASDITHENAEQSEESAEYMEVYGVRIRKKPPATSSSGRNAGPSTKAPVNTRSATVYRVVEEPLGRFPAIGDYGLDARHFIFSPDGRHVAYWVKESSGMVRLFLDGQGGPEYPNIDWNRLVVFSPDSQRLAYVVTREDGHHVVIDGQEGPPYQSIKKLVFSSDGTHTAYTAQGDGTAVVVIDGRERPEVGPFRFGTDDDIIFSPDGRRVAIVVHGPKIMVVESQGGSKCETLDGAIDVV